MYYNSYIKRIKSSIRSEDIDETIKDKKVLEKIILVKVPSETYSVLHDTFIYLFKQSGLKDINIKKEINFEELYNKNIMV